MTVNFNETNQTLPSFFSRNYLTRCGGTTIAGKTLLVTSYINTATPDKMKIIQNKFYHPNNSILCIAGDVQHEEAFKLADEIFSSWPASTIDPFQRWPIPEIYPMTGQNYFVVENDNAKTPMIMGGYQGPDTRHDLQATYAADVFSTILNLKTSSLQKALIDKGLAFNVNVGYQTCKYTGPIQIFLVPNPAKIHEAVKALKEEMAKWDSDNYFTDEQMQTAINQLEIQDAFGKEDFGLCPYRYFLVGFRKY